jgi:cytochrome P450
VYDDRSDMPKLTGFPNVPIPGPSPIPLLGHVPRVFKFLDDPIAGVTALREHGEIAAVARHNPALVCVFGPERIREVLSNPAEFRHDEDFIKAPVGSPLARVTKVLVNINGDTHKRHRRLMMPAFAKSALDGYADETVRVTETMLARWPIGEVADLHALLRDIALCVAVRSLFGLDVSEGATELGEIAVTFTDRLTSPINILLPIDLPGSPFRRLQHLAARLLSLLEGLIEQKRRSEASNDALSLLLRAVDDEGGTFTDDELMAEVMTLFIAGHETTTSALSWTMFLLERHPELLADVLAEVDGVLGGRSMTAADIPRLPLLDRIIKESLRVMAPVPVLFFRVPSREMPLGSYTVPPGTNVVVSPYATHHDPELYPEPQRFLPSRWESLKPSPWEYMPFGAGPRICIGASFGQQTLRLIMATVLQRVRVSIVRDAKITRLTRGNILMLRHGIPARLHPPHRDRLPVEPVRGNVHEMVEIHS